MPEELPATLAELAVGWDEEDGPSDDDDAALDDGADELDPGALDALAAELEVPMMHAQLALFQMPPPLMHCSCWVALHPEVGGSLEPETPAPLVAVELVDDGGPVAAPLLGGLDVVEACEDALPVEDGRELPEPMPLLLDAPVDDPPEEVDDDPPLLATRQTPWTQPSPLPQSTWVVHVARHNASTHACLRPQSLVVVQLRAQTPLMHWVPAAQSPSTLHGACGSVRHPPSPTVTHNNAAARNISPMEQDPPLASSTLPRHRPPRQDRPTPRA